MALIYWWLTIILNLNSPNLCWIESASGKDSSGIDLASGEDSSEIEPASGKDESGEDESGIESHFGSGTGMFWSFLTNLVWLFSEFMAVSFSQNWFCSD